MKSIKSLRGKAKKKAFTYQIPNGPAVRVYCSTNNAVIDRYTVVIDGADWDASANAGMKIMLGLSEGGRAFSQFTEGHEGRHLGKLIPFSILDDAMQAHIVARLS